MTGNMTGQKITFSGILYLIIVYQHTERETNPRRAVVQPPGVVIEWPGVIMYDEV